jgi:endonuclease/exonuclease/phosphatase family metal-dependent hydrolase
MRIVSWNMGCGPKQSKFRKTHQQAWTYLLDELRPDFALLQETLAVAQSMTRGRGEVLISADRNEDNGAAIFIHTGLTATPITMRSHDSFLAAADVVAPGGSLRVVSVHLYPRQGQEHQANLSTLFDLLAESLGDRPFVVAGDINAARRFDEVYGGHRYATFFGSVAERGFHDCHFGLHAKEVQTFWGRQAKESYQLDHVFVAQSWASRVRACNVVDNATVRQVSDHAPVVLDLDLAAGA